MIAEVFNCKTTLRHDIKRNYVLSINSSKIEKIFRSIFPYKGKKHKNIEEPKCNIEEKSFIAGLISGDGSIIISKNGNNINKYPLMTYVSASKVLIDIISRFLSKNNISYHIHYRKLENVYHITIKGNRLYSFIKLVPILNPIQKSKLDVLEKLGYLPPYSTYKYRLSILNNAPVV
ncbi:MAG: LAGLIDADG family homing endonuclease [Candidatus Aenigmarchaeota archaeon]|nr:LAGLIDADG family homing endonuclease [Candidatus Aenigmarchaeota archaeon]